MHALKEHLYPITEKGRERFKELFGIAGRIKPSIFWYHGSGSDLSPIFRITNRRFDYASVPSYTFFTPSLEKEPELYIYTDAIVPFEYDNIEEIKRMTNDGLNRLNFGAEEYEITDTYELIVPRESSLYENHPFYQLQQGGFEYHGDAVPLKKAYLVDIILLHSSRKISILYWKIGNMKFLKDVVLPKGMNVDYILMSNLIGGGGVHETANLILACAGALKLKGLFMCLSHIAFSADKERVLNYLEDRMIFLNASKNKFTDYYISYEGEWDLASDNVFTYKLFHLNEILTLKKEDEIRNELIISSGWPADPNSCLFDLILR